jgi:2',3'-cyclic-nucleotide 2'-phosphodiesterase (5'-nucleotidase family)
MGHPGSRESHQLSVHLRVLVTLALLAQLAAPLEVIYHADLEGRIATPRCGTTSAPEEPDYAAQVGAIRAIRQGANDRGAPSPIVLLGGDQLAPDLFARGVLADEGVPGAQALAMALARAGYDAITLGNHDLSTARDRLERFAAAARAAGMPIVVTNLRCDVAVQPFCATVVREVVVERAGQKVAILATLSPRTLETLARERLAGIALDDPRAAIAEASVRLRRQGVAAVVVMLQINSSSDGVADALALQRSLPPDQAPDLILSSSMTDIDGLRPTLLLRQEGSPALVGSWSGPRGVAHVTLTPRAPDLDGGRVDIDVEGVRSRIDQRDADTTSLLAPYVAKFCERFGTPIGTPGVKAPTSKPELIAYVLAVMQHATHSEIAFINTGMVYARAFPLTAAWTRAALRRALPHKNVVGTLMVHGSNLTTLLETAERSGKLAILGATRPAPGKSFEINGRPLDKTRSYRIATIDFLADGGHSIFTNDELKPWRPIAGAPDLRDLVEAAIARSATYDTPASDKLLTTAISDLIVDLTNIAISNDDGLADAQLARAEQRAIKAELIGLLQLDHPRHRWDSKLNAKFGYTRTQPPMMDPLAQETVDLVQLTSLYTYRGLTATRPHLPTPYARLGLETELTVPATRTYRHAELTQTAGALVTTLKAKLKLRAGAGFRTELFADGDSLDPVEAQIGGYRFIAEAGATLGPLPVVTVRKVAVTAEGNLDYFVLAPLGRSEHQLRSSAKLSLPLMPLLFLTAGIDVFGVDRETAGRGWSIDTMIGLKLHLDKTHQSL